MAAARQMQASRKLKNKTAAILKKKIKLDLDCIQNFIHENTSTTSSADASSGDQPKWTLGRYNWRVGTLEHAGRAPPSVDVKTLRKWFDPEEDTKFIDMRQQEKDFSLSFVRRYV